jgi:hypothetical protein
MDGDVLDQHLGGLLDPHPGGDPVAMHQYDRRADRIRFCQGSLESEPVASQITGLVKSAEMPVLHDAAHLASLSVERQQVPQSFGVPPKRVMPGCACLGHRPAHASCQPIAHRPPGRRICTPPRVCRSLYLLGSFSPTYRTTTECTPACLWAARSSRSLDDPHDTTHVGAA